MTIVTTVEQAYYDLIYARENVTVQEKAVELATQLVVENKKRVEVGALAPLDQKQAEAQAASSRATLIAAKSALVMQENTVKQLITDDYAAMATALILQPTAPLTAPVQVFDRQISWSKGLTERPDLLQAKLDVERQGITLKYNYNQLFPELDVVGSYGHGAGGSDITEYSQAIEPNGSRQPALLYLRRATDLPHRQHRRARHLQEEQVGDGAIRADAQEARTDDHDHD